MANSQQWLLLIHLGPIQDFIASARRCRDLWYGSKLLSELALSAANAVIQEGALVRDEAIIFPGVLQNAESDANDNQGRSVANKLQFILTDADAERVKAIAEAGRRAMNTRLAELSDDVFEAIYENLRDDKKSLFHKSTAQGQIDGLMEYMWVALPLADDASYANVRENAERLLAGRKNTRNWAPLHGSKAAVPKSSLDGMRESVIDEKVYAKGTSFNDASRRRIFGVGGEERLCGVGILKRTGDDPSLRADDAKKAGAPPFHSAGHIASSGLRARIHRSGADVGPYLNAMNEGIDSLSDFQIRAGATQREWVLRGWDGKVIDKIPRFLPNPKGAEKRLDGVLLFPSRIESVVKEYRGKDFEEVSAADLKDQIKNISSELKTLLRKVDCPEPYPYYAMILADGDKMGKALSAMTTAAEHRKFSQALETQFASRCEAIVEEHGGSLIYAGGDDVLAIVPVVSSLFCARALRDAFDKAMVDAVSGNVERPTLSVGVAVAHFLDPFANVRAYAKQAEKIAKDDAGRNAIALLVKKRGAVEKTIFGKWDDTDNAVDKRVLKWARLQSETKLPRGFAHQLEAEIESLAPRHGEAVSEDTSIYTAMVRSLVLRVIQRRRVGEKLEKQFVDLLDTYLEGQSNPFKAILTMSNEFQIAAEFRKAFEEALQGPGVLHALAGSPEAAE